LTEELTDLERVVYDFIKKYGEVLTTNLPSKMMGVIPSLESKGQIEVYKRRTTPWSSKKKKFVRIKEA